MFSRKFWNHRKLAYTIIFQVAILVLIYKSPTKWNKLPCEIVFDKWNPDIPVLLIDLDFLEKLKTEDCRWDETKQVKIGVHVKEGSGKEAIINKTRFDVVYYDNPKGKDFLEFYEDGKRIIPKRFESRWIGNFKVPTNIQRFIEFYKRSKFVECLGLEMNRNTTEKAYQNSTTSTNILARFRDELIDMGMYPFLNGGTLLGWYRECTVIPHTRDMDIAVFKENYNPEYPERVMRNETGFRISRMLGKLEDSLELTVFKRGTRSPPIDLFVMYDGIENGTLTHHYVSGVNTDGTKYRYTYPLLDPWCAADLHDHIFWVSCSPMKQVKYEYGPLWYQDHPTAKYNWARSGKNVKKVGKFSKEEMKKYYLHFKG